MLKQVLNSRLDKLLFLEFKAGAKIGNYTLEENTYMPVASDDILSGVQSGNTMENIPMSYLVEGMFTVLGCDDEFKFNDEYKDIIRVSEGASEFIKDKIAKLVKAERFEDAFVLLKGLVSVEETKEVYDRLLDVIAVLRTQDEELYGDEGRALLSRSKMFTKNPTPHYYEALEYANKRMYQDALYSINMYLSEGGVESAEITEFKQNMKAMVDFELAKELTIKEPTEAIKVLIPMKDILGDRADYYYYIAVAYRNLQNFEKAIYYLNEAEVIDKTFFELRNEYGINYSALGDYDRALAYFKPAFDQDTTVELCTNIIVCLLDSGRVKEEAGDKEGALECLKEAKEYLDRAKKLSPEDEIVKEIERYFIELYLGRIVNLLEEARTNQEEGDEVSALEYLKEAREYLDRVKELNPEDERIKEIEHYINTSN